MLSSKSKACSTQTAKKSSFDVEHRLDHLIHDVSCIRRSFIDKRLMPLGITHPQFRSHAALAQHSDMTQSELATKLEIGKFSLGALINRLERSGYVNRIVKGDDRRQKSIALTKRGATSLETLREENEMLDARIETGISRRELEIAKHSLCQMKRNLSEVAKYRPAGLAASAPGAAWWKSTGVA